MVSDSLF